MLTGVGAAQTWNTPVDKEVAPRLAEAARAVREEGPVEAFRLMNNDGDIKDLRPSCFIHDDWSSLGFDFTTDSSEIIS